jgi:gas vesicle protein
MGLSRSDESRHDFAFIAGAVIGAIAGALVTLALTPMSGADTREKLKSRAGELGPIKEKALEAAAPVKEKAGTFATTAAERGKTLAATGKERASELAAKAPISRGSHDETGMSPEAAGSMLFESQPGAHPGGTVTPGALADAGADDTDSSHLQASGNATDTSVADMAGTTKRPPRIHPIEPAEGARQPGSASGTASPPVTAAHTQDPAEGERGPSTESGNGRVSETPSSS